jgi:hypothetical protein
LYADVELPAGAAFAQPLSRECNAFIYVFEGSAAVGPAAAPRPLTTHSAGVLGPGDSVQVTAGADGARFLLIAGRPLSEPVVQHGPFVMNTREEIEQAIRDYQSGALTRAGD